MFIVKPYSKHTQKYVKNTFWGVNGKFPSKLSTDCDYGIYCGILDAIG